MQDKKKNHYFIGYRIRFDNNLINSLNKSKKYIQSLQDVKAKDLVHNYHTRFLYLGYLDNETSNTLIHDKLDPVLQLLVNKLSKYSSNMICNIDPEIKIFGHKSTYKKIGIFYKNEMIETKIVPALREIMKDIYGEYKFTYNPHINIMSIYPLNKVKTELLKSKLIHSDISLPKSFSIDSIDILKSSTIQTRTGKASKNDESKIETILTYKLNKINLSKYLNEHSNNTKKKKKTLMNEISKMFTI